MKKDVTVLGGGIVGISTALHLQARGVDVALVDRRGPGEETSFGNAGVIETLGAVPGRLPARHHHADQGGPQARAAGQLPVSAGLSAVAPWLWSYFRNSTPARAGLHRAHAVPAGQPGAGGARAADRRQQRRPSPAPHRLDAGLPQRDAVPRGGFRAAPRRRARRALRGARHRRRPGAGASSRAGVPPGRLVARHGERVRSRHAGGGLCGAVREPRAASSPPAMRAPCPRRTAGSGSRPTAGSLASDRVVLALGPWTNDVLAPRGHHIPLAIKRGYHMHYKPSGNATLNRPIVDVDGGYALAADARGLRLTTGVEFAGLRAAATPAADRPQRPYLEDLFPHIDAPRGPRALGRQRGRACRIRMPVIGPAPGEPTCGSPSATSIWASRSAP